MRFRILLTLTGILGLSISNVAQVSAGAMPTWQPVQQLQGTQEQGKQEPTKPPFKYVPAQAYYVMPETHNNQSGYFSLSEGLDGNLHIGTAAYGENAFLVEFDPTTESQRIAIDTNKVCQLTAKGYAAQAKIHTRNFVGPSGVVYVGSKQGYRLDKNDKSEYPGGYVMSYDPRNGRTTNLGMPFPGQGVADVTVDEANGIVYVVTCENQHWMTARFATRHAGGSEKLTYRELGPILTPYAMTLVAADGKAYAITDDFQLASCDPNNGMKVQTRPIKVNGKAWKRENSHSIPTWVLTPDKKRAYLILLNDSTLLEIDLVGEQPEINARSHGKMIEGKKPDCRCGLDLGADGNVYCVIRINNETGFGKGFLHHLVRFNPETRKMEDLGVLKVQNPDFFDWDKKDAEGNLQKWIHGFHRLPDDTLTPMHAHMSLKTTADNTIYITIIYPFTLLKIDQFKLKKQRRPAEKYLDWAEQVTLDAEQNLPQFTKVGETIAKRHLDGGLIGFPFLQQAVTQDLLGRSGGLVHIGFSRPWKEARTEKEKSNDVAIIGYESEPGKNDLKTLNALKERGVYIVGFGPSKLKALTEIKAVCDAWFDTGLDPRDRVIRLADGSFAGRGNAAVNAIHGATLIAEVIGALTRKGKMPTIWKGYAYDDGRAWGDKYFRKKQFHDDYHVPPIDQAELGRKFLTQIRYPIRRLRGQRGQLQKTASLMQAEVKAKRVIFVGWQGHMPPTYIGKGADSWATPAEFHPFLQSQVDSFSKKVPDGAFVLNLGYHGIDPIQAKVFKQKSLRVVHLSGDHPDRKWQPGNSWLQTIDLGYSFGDSCVSIDGYPLCLFAPSGIAQVLAYEAIQVEMAELAK